MSHSSSQFPRMEKLERHHAIAARRRATARRIMLEALESRTLLSTVMVTSNADSGAGSLRAAIASAAGGDIITFASGLRGTIHLQSELRITRDLAIEGPGAGVINVSGGGSVRDFEVGSPPSPAFALPIPSDEPQHVTISGLAISDGMADGGARSSTGAASRCPGWRCGETRRWEARRRHCRRQTDLRMRAFWSVARTR